MIATFAIEKQIKITWYCMLRTNTQYHIKKYQPEQVGIIFHCTLSKVLEVQRIEVDMFPWSSR